MNKSDYCEYCPDEDISVCDNCKGILTQDTSRQNEIINTISEKFQESRNTIRKRCFGEKAEKDMELAKTALVVTDIKSKISQRKKSTPARANNSLPWTEVP